MLGAINKILKHSAVDGPGNRFVIFFQGCNFNCSYCHNPETIQVCPTSSSPKVNYLSVSCIMEQIEKVKHFISGVTISGGECTLQYDFLKKLLIECRHKNISTFIDTNAHLEFEKMKELSLYFDKAMPDIKVFNENQHFKLTGKLPDLVFKNIEFLLQRNKVYEIRTVIYPEIDYKETVEKVSSLIAKLNKAVTYKLIKFRNYRAHLNLQSPSDKTMLELKDMAENLGCSNIMIT